MSLTMTLGPKICLCTCTQSNGLPASVLTDRRTHTHTNTNENITPPRFCGGVTNRLSTYPDSLDLLAFSPSENKEQIDD